MITEKPRAWPLISALLGLALFSYSLGGILAFLLTCVIHKQGVVEFQQLLLMPGGNENSTQIIITYVTLNSLLSFLIVPLFYLRITDDKISYTGVKKPDFGISVLSVVIVIAAVPLTSYLAGVNQSIKFPSFLSGLEGKLLEYESFSKNITNFLLSSEQPGLYIKLAMSIAILPGIVEEFFFRKVLQSKLVEFIRNEHYGVLISSVAFSIMHFQFYGLVPRFVFGMVFGYIYLWSGNLLYPILAHIANNLLIVTLTYYFGTEGIGLQDVIDDPVVIFCSIVTLVVILFTVKKNK